MYTPFLTALSHPHTHLFINVYVCLYVCRELLALIAVAVISTSSAMIAGAICQPPACFIGCLKKKISQIFNTNFVCLSIRVCAYCRQEESLDSFPHVFAFYATFVFMCFLENHATPLQNVF